MSSSGTPATPTASSRRRTLGRVLLLVLLLFAFFVGLDMMGLSFKLFGKGFAEAMIARTANPFVGLLVGILATSLVQSSSTTTSMTVGLVAAGALTIDGAIPIIMGANIGTSVTNTLVSLGHVTRREEFRRAFAGATLHDFFNLLTVAILFPLELTFHVLRNSAEFLERVLEGTGGIELFDPLKAVVRPVAKWLSGQLGSSGTLTLIAGVALPLPGAQVPGRPAQGPGLVPGRADPRPDAVPLRARGDRRRRGDHGDGPVELDHHLGDGAAGGRRGGDPRAALPVHHRRQPGDDHDGAAGGARHRQPGGGERGALPPAVQRHGGGDHLPAAAAARGAPGARPRPRRSRGRATARRRSPTSSWSSSACRSCSSSSPAASTPGPRRWPRSTPRRRRSSSRRRSPSLSRPLRSRRPQGRDPGTGPVDTE